MKNDKSALPYLSRNADWQAALDADEVEFRAVMMGTASREEGTREERWSGEIEENLSGVRPAWIEREEALELQDGDIAGEIERRALLLGDTYPFDLDGSRVAYRPSRSRVYEFCLAVSVAPSLSAGILKGLPVAFEHLVCEILRLHVGATGQVMRTGWPRDSSCSLTRAKQLFAQLHKLSGEWIWQPQGLRPDDPPPTYEKDLGLDVVAWRPMPDGRIGQLFLLGQCACGKSDWESKWKDIDLEELGFWFRPATHVTAVRCFCVPFHIGNTITWEEVSAKAGLSFDRARISLFAERDPGFLAERTAKSYSKWVETVASELLTAGSKRKRKGRNSRR